MPKHSKFIRIAIKDVVHIFELATIKPGALDIEKSIACPCCQMTMDCCLDITQYGFFEDKFILLFACEPCGKAYWYAYTLGQFELTEHAFDMLTGETNDRASE